MKKKGKRGENSDDANTLQPFEERSGGGKLSRCGSRGGRRDLKQQQRLRRRRSGKRLIHESQNKIKIRNGDGETTSRGS